MPTTIINVRTDIEVKKQAERIYKELGINMSTAINIFLKETIREKGIPFDLKLEAPNKRLEESFKEGDEIANDEKIKGYKTVSELKKSLDEI